MRLLLDTNVFLWTAWLTGRLSPAAARALNEPTNQLLVSTATPWEIAIRLNQLIPGRGNVVHRFYQTHMRYLVAGALLITSDHALATYGLPPIHRDPFDRMLIAQAKTEGLIVVTNDERFQQYGVDVIW